MIKKIYKKLLQAMRFRTPCCGDRFITNYGWDKDDDGMKCKRCGTKYER